MLLDYGHMTVPADWTVMERAAPGFSRVYYVRGGTVTYSDDHIRKPLCRNTVYVFPSAAPFQIQHDPENPLSCTYLHLDIFPVLLRELVVLPAEPGNFLETLFAAITGGILQEGSRIVAGLSEVFLQYCRERGTLETPELEISVPLYYIADHIREGAVTIEELSSLVGYNPQYFIRLFQRAVGMTPHQYITNYRLSESVKLLRQERCTVSEVAEQVGYPDVKAFGRAFKEKYGITATQFRRMDMSRP